VRAKRPACQSARRVRTVDVVLHETTRVPFRSSAEAKLAEATSDHGVAIKGSA